MQALRAIAVMLAVAAGCLEAGRAADPQPAADAPSASEVLQSVVAGLPREALSLDGELLVRRRHGVVLRQLAFRMDLHWGEAPSRAVYTLSDAFGRPLERLTVLRDTNGLATCEYASGKDLAPAALPDLSASLRETDLTWHDMTLSFLWWPGGAVAGEEKVFDQDCFVVEVPAPDGAQAGAPAAEAERVAVARLWIAKKARMLLRAEGLNARREPVRRLWVRSFKKFDDRWMIKDMEVQRLSSGHRTKLTIRKLAEDDAPAAGGEEVLVPL